MKTHRRWTAKELRQAVQWRAEGVRSKEIARRLGRTAATVCSMLGYYGCRTQSRSSREETEEAVKRLHAQGHSDSEIAKRIGRSRSHVAAVRARLGLSYNRVPGCQKEAHHDWLQAKGVNSLADLRWLRQWKEANAAGLPQMKTISDLKMFQGLRPHFPIRIEDAQRILGTTRAQAIQILYRWRKRGIVVIRETLRREGRAGKPPKLYDLSPALKRDAND